MLYIEREIWVSRVATLDAVLNIHKKHLKGTEYVRFILQFQPKRHYIHIWLLDVTFCLFILFIFNINIK
jgi:hypothetical protein